MRLFLYPLLALFFLSTYPLVAQSTIAEALKKWTTGEVPALATMAVPEEALLIDTREKTEFNVSHLEGAHWVGYQSFDLSQFLKTYPDLNTPIIAYCSIGVRSEKIGIKLLKAGYTNVKNLYGGIFEWKNEGGTVVDPQGQPTEKVHAYNRFWGQLLTNADKVY
ncbi:MAG: rhodanese-like domain-containing protein [Bacteroidota bacterium]